MFKDFLFDNLEITFQQSKFIDSSFITPLFREVHSKIVTASREKGASTAAGEGKEEEEDTAAHQLTKPIIERTVDQQQPYVHYTPTDLHYEKGLVVYVSHLHEFGLHHEVKTNKILSLTDQD